MVALSEVLLLRLDILLAEIRPSQTELYSGERRVRRRLVGVD